MTSRSELYEILAFFETRQLLPFYCEVYRIIATDYSHKILLLSSSFIFKVHSIVLAALNSRNPCYRIYYVSTTSNNDCGAQSYEAIVGVKKENAAKVKKK